MLCVERLYEFTISGKSIQGPASTAKGTISHDACLPQLPCILLGSLISILVAYRDNYWLASGILPVQL
jgi:hypothetical protein